jgi:hypothetical protein
VKPGSSAGTDTDLAADTEPHLVADMNSGPYADMNSGPYAGMEPGLCAGMKLGLFAGMGPGRIVDIESGLVAPGLGTSSVTSPRSLGLVQDAVNPYLLGRADMPMTYAATAGLQEGGLHLLEFSSAN